MDYKETLSWLFSQLPMYQRVGKAAYKADLSNTEKILKVLGNPERDIVAIHIAGTNGKGSVSHIIASVLQEAGFKTGLYTSPHLKDFRERIKINGELIPENSVTAFVEKYQQDFLDIESSFFEMTVGMAFDYFNKEQVDYAVIETGMGGRLDSTNLCNPIITIITNIGYDHTFFLGDTLDKIAVEKAGIIKPDVPVVIGKHQLETDNIFMEKANQQKTKLTFAEDIIDLKLVKTDSLNTRVYDVWKGSELDIENLESPLIGEYQSENIVTALAGVNLINHVTGNIISKEMIAEGIKNTVLNTGLMGRWQVISTNPQIICDTGHNIDGIKAIVRQLSTTAYNQLHFVVGMVSDKNTYDILSLLPKNATYYFCKPDIPRGLDENILAETAFKAGLNGKTYSSVGKAVNAAKNNSMTNDLIFVGGSTFVVAEVI